MLEDVSVMGNCMHMDHTANCTCMVVWFLWCTVKPVQNHWDQLYLEGFRVRESVQSCVYSLYDWTDERQWHIMTLITGQGVNTGLHFLTSKHWFSQALFPALNHASKLFWTPNEADHFLKSNQWSMENILLPISPPGQVKPVYTYLSGKLYFSHGLFASLLTSEFPDWGVVCGFYLSIDKWRKTYGSTCVHICMTQKPQKISSCT